MPLLVDQWEEDTLSPLDIQLDDQNPRVDPQHRTNQDRILQCLIDREGVSQLAKSINSYRGLFPQERVIVTEIAGSPVVLEGNRRVAACKLLLRPEVLPDVYMHKISSIPPCDDLTRAQIDTIPVVFAATRAIADEVIASLHLNSGKKDWSDIGQFRYAADRYKSGRTVQEIAQSLHISAKETLRLLAYDEAFNFVLGLGWSEEEKDILWDFNINVKPFLAICFSRKAESHFGLPLFDEYGRANTALFDVHAIVQKIAGHTLISQGRETDVRFTEGASIEKYLSRYFPKSSKSSPNAADLFVSQEQTHIQESCLDEEPLASSSPSSDSMDNSSIEEFEIDNGIVMGGGRQNLAYEDFFEKLKCTRLDDIRMVQLCRELKRLSQDLHTYRIAAALIMRSTLEWCLRYHLDQIGQIDEVRKVDKQFKLSSLIKYCAQREKRVFPDDSLRRRMTNLIAQQTLNELDLIAHSDSGNWNPDKLKHLAGDIRPIIQFVMEDAKY